MKISVLTPTYNDSESIEDTLLSLVNQTYKDWEWIVINDGSTDNTENRIREIIEKYHIEDKCKYIYEENADQLNALCNGINYITGDYVFVLHSDDLLPDDNFFENCIKEMNKHPEADGLFGNLIIIDENSNETGMQKVKNYHVNDNMPATMLLWLGRNLYSDVAFHKADVYKNIVKNNYLIWNMPLWLDFQKEGIKMVNYVSVDFPVLKYRVHSGNYINNELGKMNVINGELRTATELMKFYNITSYKKQYFKFRLLNKLKPDHEYKVKYKKEPADNRYEVISFIVGKRYSEDEDKHIFLDSLLAFYKADSQRLLEINHIPEDIKLYYGKDVRSFNKSILDNTLEPFYLDFMNEMKKGFCCVKVKTEKDMEIMTDILKFLCIGHIKTVYSELNQNLDNRG